MRKLLIIKLCFLVMLCIGLAAFVYQLWAILSSDTNTSDVKSSKYKAVNIISSNENQDQAGSTTKFTSPPLLIDYSILPEVASTQDTKLFFENLYVAGYIGKNDSFQQVLRSLETEQILANILLRDDEVDYLNTVNIQPNMLSMSQIQSCNQMVKHLLQDLKIMCLSDQCNSEQQSVINLLMGRLTYLTQSFSGEFDKFQVMDPLLLHRMDPQNNIDNVISLRPRPFDSLEHSTETSPHKANSQENKALADEDKEPTDNQKSFSNFGLAVTTETPVHKATDQKLKTRESIRLD